MRTNDKTQVRCLGQKPEGAGTSLFSMVVIIIIASLCGKPLLAGMPGASKQPCWELSDEYPSLLSLGWDKSEVFQRGIGRQLPTAMTALRGTCAGGLPQSLSSTAGVAWDCLANKPTVCP